jgi:hypothetical protein
LEIVSNKKDGLSAEALDFFRKQGAKGGKARKKKLTKEELSEQGRKAVMARWAKAKKKLK